jgi:hypothetical protein
MVITSPGQSHFRIIPIRDSIEHYILPQQRESLREVHESSRCFHTENSSSKNHPYCLDHHHQHKHLQEEIERWVIRQGATTGVRIIYMSFHMKKSMAVTTTRGSVNVAQASGKSLESRITCYPTRTIKTFSNLRVSPGLLRLPSSFQKFRGLGELGNF